MYRDIKWEGMACEYDGVKPIRDTDKGRLYLSKPFLLCIKPTSRVQQGVTQVSLTHPIHQLPIGRQCGVWSPACCCSNPSQADWADHWGLALIIYLLYLSYSRPGILLFHTQIGFVYAVELEQVEALVFLKERQDLHCPGVPVRLSLYCSSTCSCFHQQYSSQEKPTKILTALFWSP